MITILVVDDEPLVVSLIQRAASQRGYEVIGTANPFEALEILQDPSRPISVLLTDLMMPGLNGRRVSPLGRATTREGLPVIYMSGYDDIDPGGDENPESKFAVLSKPFPGVRAADIAGGGNESGIGPSVGPAIEKRPLVDTSGLNY